MGEEEEDKVEGFCPFCSLLLKPSDDSRVMGRLEAEAKAGCWLLSEEREEEEDEEAEGLLCPTSSLWLGSLIGLRGGGGHTSHLGESRRRW